MAAVIVTIVYQETDLFLLWCFNINKYDSAGGGVCAVGNCMSCCALAFRKLMVNRLPMLMLRSPWPMLLLC
jgi:hypothetical protein